MANVPLVPYEVQKVSVILYKIGASCSMIGSFLTLRDVWHRFREKKEVSLTTSLVCELSLCDFFSSFFGPFLGTWMVPKETGAYLAAGTTASCTAQGFLVNTFYGASAACNASLAIAYCLIVKKGWRDSRSNSIGNWLLLVSPLIGFTFPVGPLFDKGYNFGGVGYCDIMSYPLGCESDISDAECTRGQNTIYFRLYALCMLFILNVIIIVSVSMLIHSVWVIERRMDRYHGDGRANRVATLKTTWQGIWYIAAFALAWWSFAIKSLVNIFIPHPPNSVQYFYCILFSSQGVYNAVVYFRPKYKLDREKNERDTRLTSFCRVLRLLRLRHFLANMISWDTKKSNSPKSLGGDLENIPQAKSDTAVNVNISELLESAEVVEV